MTDPSNGPPRKQPDNWKDAPLRSFGRTGGRPLSPRRAALIDDLLPRIRVPTDNPLSLADMFGAEPESLWLEIGFGGGEHLAQQAASHPETAFIGAEPFVEGVAKLLAEAQSQNLENVRVHPGDVRDILDQLPAKSVDRVFILFPDPWPKARHRKRRLINAAFLQDLGRILKPGGRLRFATDISDYAEQALAELLADGRFIWEPECADDWRIAPADHIETRYQLKRLGDCDPVYLDFTFEGASAS